MVEKQLHYSKSRKFAEWLDSHFTIPGTNIKFGIDPVLGLFSGIGDLAGASLSIYFMFYATRLGAESSIILRMFMNILADLTIGSIPILGDLFDVAWKANLRNAKLLEKLEQNPDKLETESTVLMWVLFIVLVAVLIGVIVAVAWLFAEAWLALFG
ncbi:DUF4112 domain-containing protein [Rhodohalobacter sp. 614A]|uniref:DUF4112 domain-containing protein n=1 Tax=Rhodohalobacter sp. 614A TaxID=2908649 RepID=UPI001F1BB2AF|nr:DUF4112 domain-containing protein [Rhodohalobacter sp. 614A]